MLETRILAVAVGRPPFNKLDPLLRRSYFAVERVLLGQDALRLCRNAWFHLILVSYPLPDMSLETFLGALRKERALSARSRLLVLTEEVRLAELPESLQRGPDLALAVEEPQIFLEKVASGLLKVAPRASQRRPLTLEARFGDEPIIGQTRNISEAGMLVHTDHPVETGTPLSFELALPHEPAAIRGQATVVRHAATDIAGQRAVGLKFTGFQDDGLRRLQSYLAAHRLED